MRRRRNVPMFLTMDRNLPAGTAVREEANVASLLIEDAQKVFGYDATSKL